MRQLAKEQDEQIRHQIDSDFGNIRDLLFGAKPDPSSSGSNAIPLGMRSSRIEDAADSAPPADGSLSAPGPSSLPLPKPQPAILDDDDDYDQAVRQLTFDQRAKPTDRTKTDEEIAGEEAEKLQKQERARLRRMRGDSDASESDNDERPWKRRRGAPQADDLDDDFEFSEGEAGVLGPGLEDAVLGGSSDEDEDEGLGEDTAGEIESDTGSEKGESEDAGSDDCGDASDPDSSHAVALKHKAKRKEPRKQGELPFTFPAPSSHEEFLEILEDIDPSEIPTVVQRIRTIYHPSLAEDNKFKLQVCLIYSRADAYADVCVADSVLCAHRACSAHRSPPYRLIASSERTYPPYIRTLQTISHSVGASIYRQNCIDAEESCSRARQRTAPS